MAESDIVQQQLRCPTLKRKATGPSAQAEGWLRLGPARKSSYGYWRDISSPEAELSCQRDVRGGIFLAVRHPVALSGLRPSTRVDQPARLHLVLKRDDARLDPFFRRGLTRIISAVNEKLVQHGAREGFGAKVPIDKHVEIPEVMWIPVAGAGKKEVGGEEEDKAADDEAQHSQEAEVMEAHELCGRATWRYENLPGLYRFGITIFGIFYSTTTARWHLQMEVLSLVRQPLSELNSLVPMWSQTRSCALLGQPSSAEEVGDEEEEDEEDKENSGAGSEVHLGGLL